MRTIAIDFDGVIHKYSRGWLDGKIYDDPIKDSLKFIQWCVENHYSVFIFSTRKPRQIKKWLKKYCAILSPMGDKNDLMWEYKFKPVIIPPWKKFWNKKNSKPTREKPVKIGITRRKLPAMIYIDDRACKFDGSWKEIYKQLI